MNGSSAIWQDKRYRAQQYAAERDIGEDCGSCGTQRSNPDLYNKTEGARM